MTTASQTRFTLGLCMLAAGGCWRNAPLRMQYLPSCRVHMGDMFIRYTTHYIHTLYMFIIRYTTHYIHTLYMSIRYTSKIGEAAPHRCWTMHLRWLVAVGEWGFIIHLLACHWSDPCCSISTTVVNSKLI
jgi:hypothetical protein